MTGQPKGSKSAHPRSSCLVAEVIGNSPIDFETAIFNAIGALTDSGIHPTGVDVIGQKISLDKNAVTNYRVVLKVSYDGAL